MSSISIPAHIMYNHISTGVSITGSDTESIDHAKAKAIQESLTKVPPTEPVVDVYL